MAAMRKEASPARLKPRPPDGHQEEGLARDEHVFVQSMPASLDEHVFVQSMPASLGGLGRK
eukprot:1317766-Amphidinium_carterae.1